MCESLAHSGKDCTIKACWDENKIGSCSSKLYMVSVGYSQLVRVLREPAGRSWKVLSTDVAGPVSRQLLPWQAPAVHTPHLVE